MNNKLSAYLGFAIKSKSVIFGLDNLSETTRKVALVLCDNTLSDNSYVKLVKLCEYRKWKMYQLTDCTIEQLIGRSTKVLGILDNNLSKAIIDNIN